MRYTGPLGKSFAGDKQRAMSLQSRARVLVGRLLYALKRQGGKGQQYGTERQDDGSVIHAYVLANIAGQQPLIRTWIESPVFSGGGIVTQEAGNFPGIVAFIPASGQPFYDFEGGTYINAIRYTYSAESLSPVTGLLGQPYMTTIVGKEGDHRERIPETCGWLARKSKKTGRWSATGHHTGYFGNQNWLGQDGDDGKPDRDIVSWDGPRSRYAKSVVRGLPRRGGRVFHRLRILADLFDPDAWIEETFNTVCILGAGIHHHEDGPRLYVIAYKEPVLLNVVWFPLTIEVSTDEQDEFPDRYVTNPWDIQFEQQFSVRNEMLAMGYQDAPQINTGFYFNASGTNAVCTIGTKTSYETFLLHYSITNGFTFESAYSASNLQKDEGDTAEVTQVGGEPQVVFSTSCVDIGQSGTNPVWVSLITSWKGYAEENARLEYNYKVLSHRQIVCADYVGDELVYLYYTNPETKTTQLYNSNWSATFEHWDSPSGWPLPQLHTGTMNNHDVANDVTTETGNHVFASSDGRLRWEGGSCYATMRGEGQEQTFLSNPTVTADYYIPNQYTGPPCTPRDRALAKKWNGWVYNNPTVCYGEIKKYSINFLDLRFGLMSLIEEAQTESAEVEWLLPFWDYPQYADGEIVKSMILVNGGSVAKTIELEREPYSHVIGSGINEGGYGLAQFWRMRDLYLVYHEGGNWGQTWNTGAKAWRSCVPVSTSTFGSMSMLKVADDLIYTIPIGVTSNYDPNLGYAPDGELIQTSSWAGNTNPQAAFFEGSVNAHYLANLSLV